jgi:hypothetical protein
MRCRLWKKVKGIRPDKNSVLGSVGRTKPNQGRENKSKKTCREGQTKLRAERAIPDSGQRRPNKIEGREGQTKLRADRAKPNSGQRGPNYAQGREG